MNINLSHDDVEYLLNKAEEDLELIGTRDSLALAEHHALIEKLRHHKQDTSKFLASEVTVVNKKFMEQIGEQIDSLRQEIDRIQEGGLWKPVENGWQYFDHGFTPFEQHYRLVWSETKNMLYIDLLNDYTGECEGYVAVITLPENFRICEEVFA